MLLNRPSDEGVSQTFSTVFEEELVQIRQARENRGIPVPDKLAEDLIGLAFSGGGIRSATFNLGVLQAFARNHLLSKIDYLSTVSGGGYIGSWLSSWAYWIGKEDKTIQNQAAEIENRLNHAPQNITDLAEPHEVHFLRKYSNYLTPKLGLLSGDTLAFIGTYLRNLLLNQAILISTLLALLLVPRSIGVFFYRFSGTPCKVICGAVASVLLVVAFVGVLLNIRFADDDAAVQSDNVPAGSQDRKKNPLSVPITFSVFWWVALPLFLSCFLLTHAIWGFVTSPNTLWNIKSQEPRFVIKLVVFNALAYTILWVMITGAVAIIAKIKKAFNPSVSTDDKAALRWIPALWAFPAGLVGGLLAWWSCCIMSNWGPSQPHSIWYLLTFGVPLVTVLFLTVGVVHLGCIGRRFGDRAREWFARLCGFVLAIALCWFLVCVATLFLPLWLHLIYSSGIPKIWQILSTLGLTTGIGGWITVTLKGLFAAKSTRTGPVAEDMVPSSQTNKADMLARLAPAIFVIGLIAFLSWLLSVTVPAIEGITQTEDYWTLVSASTWWVVPSAAGGLFLASRFLGERVDVNEFSLHNAYRNRLVRCYLGATHHKRRPEPFTGFDEQDNIFIHHLLGLGAPFHILNATLNVTKGKELALQARKARSFTFTPLYSGFEYTEEESVAQMSGEIPVETKLADTTDVRVKKRGAYRLSKNFSLGSSYRGGRLGTAMAISGAAVSPNMGHYSTGAVSFLLTIFSVRLGWWLGNPQRKKDWEAGHPRSSWKALMRELTGNTNEDQSEVYLSDGGHFDNLGVYELVRRRCQLIIACDAGADASYACGDLASVIEKCRVDFHTEITINLDDIRPTVQTLPGGQSIRASKSPFAVGDIVYPNHRKGILIYIKPALNANLPQDVLAYARQETFPHQSTVDQFFDETQFESYRALGFACASDAVNVIQSVNTGMYES